MRQGNLLGQVKRYVHITFSSQGLDAYPNLRTGRFLDEVYTPSGSTPLRLSDTSSIRRPPLCPNSGWVSQAHLADLSR
ncbi:MAG: hypothetical protein Kow0047_05840 [Anaerolineae bacterium]